MKSIKKQQIIAFLTCIIFLFTSCPMPEDNPPKKEDTGKVFKCYIDEEGNPTEQEEESAGKMYWVEKDGKVQPGTATLLRKDNIINVVNISDPETQKTYRMYFMDGANLPYRLIVEGEGITVVGSNIRYDEKAETLSLLWTDKNTGDSEELSGIRLNSDLFNLKVHNQYENYYVSMAACFVYAIDYYEDNYINSSENVTRGWKSFLTGLFSAEAIVSFVVAVVTAPVVVVTGSAIVASVTAANAGWVVAGMASATAAVITQNIPDEAFEKDGAYGSNSSEEENPPEPPKIFIYQVDSEGNPIDTPNAEDCFENNGVVCLHNNEENYNEVIFCIEIKGEDKPKSIEFAQSKHSKNSHKIYSFENISERESLFDTNSQSISEYIPNKFYFSIMNIEDSIGMDDYKKVFVYLKFSLDELDFVSVINGSDLPIETELTDENGNIEEPKLYTNVFKVNICTLKMFCPNSSLEEETLIPNV